MSLFSSLDTNNVVADKDVLGGYEPLSSGIYNATIKAAYVTTSRNGAMAVNVLADINGQEYRETLWITNREGKPFYVSKKTGEKIFLPGYVVINDICLATLGKPLKETDAQPRTFKIYDVEAKKELPKEVPTMIELIGKQVCLAIVRETVDKTVRDASGNYVPSGETKDQNVISKVFDFTTHRTVNEIREHVAEASFYDKWLVKNEGITRNRAKGAQEGASHGMAGMPMKPAAAPAFQPQATSAPKALFS